MPWTYENPPAVAQNWDPAEIRDCVDAANAVLAEGGDDEAAIYACIHAAGKANEEKGESKMKRKSYKATIELKGDSDKGEFRSVFASFNVVDHDNDITLPGAFTEGQEVVVEGYGHGQGLPAGKGKIRSDDEVAWVEGKLFLDTALGKEHYRTLKNLAGLAEWSYTFTIKESTEETRDGEDVRVLEALDVFGVAPVTRGAGIGTGTLSLKARLTDAEVEKLLALIESKDDVESEAVNTSEGSGEAEGAAASDGKPEGLRPGIVLATVRVFELELNQ